ncbi:alpha/beta-hydrolase family protein [Brevundimonas terrae]|uniref:Alpha/beta-hydrolase family protein n=1 Tax=Brevundimonas terrae TaxID=363631 RepID=A0ABN0YEF5_9CAUL|nr:alpha/beta-hydrolase family protein [Brevundimonas terrae]NIJ26674.1 putative membrane protein [Brevundimonas terrae]
MWRKILRPFGVVSSLGILLGAICFFTALSPSLVPRSGLLQGVLAGCCFAAGYGIGVLIASLWKWLELPVTRTDIHRRIYFGALAIGAILILAALILAAGWQNDVHRAMNLPPVESVRPFTISGVALVVAAILLAIGRLFRRAARTVSSRLSGHLPQKIAILAGVLAALALFNFIGSEVILGQGFKLFDKTYARVDATISDDTIAPADPLKTGSSASLLDWNTLGAEGRKFILATPDAEQISAITSRPALEPLRVYVGMGSAEDADTRAQLALDEAIRIGAFERKVLVLATPTGTGWMDPSAHFPLETLLDGDVATIGVQYSYLPSWLSLLAVPEYGSESARAVFLAFHDYWAALPADSRPQLYLFGLSLGAMNTDLSYDYYDIVDAPPNGVFMAGPPFTSRSWNQITHDRDAGSPAWLPTFRDGKVVRFMSQKGVPDHGTVWADTRILYLQYASDGIVFFSPSLIWQRPQWLDQPHGPDVSPKLRWFPVVTFLQVGFDLLTATSTPRGHGHVYDGGDYMEGWNAILKTERPPEERESLREAMKAQDL